MKKVLVVLLIVTMCVTSMVACGGSQTTSGTPGTDETVLIGLSIRGLDNPYYVQLKEAAEMFMAAFPDQKFELQILESGGSDEKQINDVKAFLARCGENGILYVDPNNAPNAAVIAELCEDAGVYWNTTWSYAEGVYPMDYEYYVVHETADNVGGSYEVAKAMFDAFETPGKGKIVGIAGMLSNDASIDRVKGLEKALAEYPDIELLDLQPGNWSPQESLALAQTWISKYGDEIDGIWVANDTCALAVAEALRAEGLNGKVLVTGFDCIDDFLTGIEKGDVFATYAANPYMQGGYGLAYDYAAYTGQIVPSELPDEKRMILTKGIAVTKDTLADYIAEFVDSKPQYDYTNLDFCIAAPMDLNNLK